MSIFAENNRGDLKSKLWCLCSGTYSPHVISNSKQQVSFKFFAHGSDLYVSAIYASTNYIERRDLWT